VWFGGVRNGRFGFLGKKKAGKVEWQAKLEKLKELRERVFVALEEFRAERRHVPYLLFSASSYDGFYLSDMLFLTHISPPSTRGNKRCRPIGTSSIAMCTNIISPKWELLFLSWSARSLLLQRIYANIQDIKLDEAIELESSRMENKLWTPIRALMLWWPWDMSEHGQQDESDDNPSLYILNPFSFMLTNGWDVVDIVQGAQPVHGDLGIARRRDPDALPPRNVLEWCLNYVYLFLSRGGGNLLYAVKAGLFTGVPRYFCFALRVPKMLWVVILCLPSFFPSSATFAFSEDCSLPCALFSDSS